MVKKAKIKQEKRENIKGQSRTIKFYRIYLGPSYLSVGRDVRPIKSFKKKYGHCNVPDKSSSYRSLGGWVGNQRSKYKKEKLSLEAIKKLNALKFVWNPRSKV